MKKILTLLIVLTFGLALSACGNKQTTTEPTSIDTSITGPVSITFWTAFGADKNAVLQTLVNQFTALNPDISVTIQGQGSYDDLHDKTVQSIVTGDTPTMLLGYPNHVADYLQGNGVVSLDPYVNDATVGLSASDISDYVPAYLQENTQFGHYYGLPFNKSTEVLVYNKTFFADNNLTVPQTWDDVVSVSQQILTILHNPSADQQIFPFSWDSTGNLFTTLTHQFAGQYTDEDGNYLFNNDQTIAALNFYATQHTAGLFTVPAEWQDTYSSAEFTNNQAYMTISSTAGMSYNVPLNGAFEIGCAPIPYKDADHKAVIQQGTDISIMTSADSQQRLAAWLLTKYLTNKESTLSWAEQTGYLPVRQSALDDASYQTWLLTADDATNPNYNAMAEQAAAIEVPYMFTDPSFIGSTDARTAAETVVADILFSNENPATAVADAIHDLNN